MTISARTESCRSVDRQTNLGEQLLECRIAAKGRETLVLPKIQHAFVMRLDGECQVLEGFASVCEPSGALRHRIERLPGTWAR